MRRLSHYKPRRQEQLQGTGTTCCKLWSQRYLIGLIVLAVASITVLIVLTVASITVPEGYVALQKTLKATMTGLPSITVPEGYVALQKTLKATMTGFKQRI
jgi:hypothetical protein